MKRCDICDCNKLCKRVAQAGAKGITCKEMFEMVLEIINKNIDSEDEEYDD